MSDPRLESLLAKVRETASFESVDFSDINASNPDGDNALHCVVTWGDLRAAELLIDAGIDLNKAGDLGHTPLHNACIRGDFEMVKLLVSRDADLFALSEGDAPFTCARLARKDEICDFLGAKMKEAQSRDPKIWLRARIAQLQRELSFLRARLENS
jgi:ankyrin repeat protein